MSMNKRNIEILFTLKAHCEIAGRGIEYIWGIAKVSFRKDNAKLQTSKRVTSLNTRVRKSIFEIPLKMIRCCARKTREYKLSYRTMHKMSETNEPFKLKDIEKVKKEVKGKRCALDQDNGFIVKCFEKMKSKIKSEKGQRFKFKQE